MPPRSKWVAATDEFYVRRAIDKDGELVDQPLAGVDGPDASALTD